MLIKKLAEQSAAKTRAVLLTAFNSLRTRSLCAICLEPYPPLRLLKHNHDGLVWNRLLSETTPALSFCASSSQHNRQSYRHNPRLLPVLDAFKSVARDSRGHLRTQKN